MNANSLASPEDLPHLPPYIHRSVDNLKLHNDMRLPNPLILTHCCAWIVTYFSN